MRDRLDGIEDLFLEDTSPREAWAIIRSERVMRRETARALKNAANQLYAVDQESVTADENETDIRMRSTQSPQQGVIELKLGERYSTNQLMLAIREQLLGKYMRSDECRAGCLLVTVADKERQWEHPETKQRVGFEELIVLLNEHAVKCAAEVGGAATLMVRGMDLR
jgi:hypothetical protein